MIIYWPFLGLTFFGVAGRSQHPANSKRKPSVKGRSNEAFLFGLGRHRIIRRLHLLVKTHKSQQTPSHILIIIGPPSPQVTAHCSLLTLPIQLERRKQQATLPCGCFLPDTRYPNITTTMNRHTPGSGFSRNIDAVTVNTNHAVEDLQHWQQEAQVMIDSLAKTNRRSNRKVEEGEPEAWDEFRVLCPKLGEVSPMKVVMTKTPLASSHKKTKPEAETPSVKAEKQVVAAASPKKMEKEEVAATSTQPMPEEPVEVVSPKEVEPEKQEEPTMKTEKKEADTPKKTETNDVAASPKKSKKTNLSSSPKKSPRKSPRKTMPQSIQKDDTAAFLELLVSPKKVEPEKQEEPTMKTEKKEADTPKKTETNDVEASPKKSKKTNLSASPKKSPRKSPRKTMPLSIQKDDTAAFLELLDLNLFCADRLHESAFLAMIEKKPELVHRKYPFKALGGNRVYPLHVIVALGAGLDCVEACYNAHPEAAKDSSVGTPLHFAATCNATMEVVHFLAKKDRAFLKVTNKNGKTPLHLACEHGSDASTVFALTSRCPQAAAMADKLGRTPLHWACAAKQPILEVVQDLMQVYPAAGHVRDYHGMTPLTVALENAFASEEILHQVVNLESASLRNNVNMSTALHIAVQRTNLTIHFLKELIRAFPKALQMKDGQGRIPLHAALDCGARSSICQTLVKKWPTSVEIRNKRGEIPHAAAQRLKREQDLVEFLYPFEEVVSTPVVEKEKISKSPRRTKSAV